MNTLLAQALLQEQRYYHRTPSSSSSSSFPSPLSAPLLHHEIGTPLMPTDPPVDPTSSSSSSSSSPLSHGTWLRPFMRPGESRQDQAEGIGVAPRSAWPSEEAYQKALRAYDRAQAFLAVQGGAESENTRWHHPDPMSPYKSKAVPRGGVDPAMAAMQEHEFYQGLASGAISEYKAGKIAELAEQARMTPSNTKQARKQASLLISGGQTEQTWMAVQGDGTKMETRAERLAIEEAARPEIAAFYEKMAQAASQRAGRAVSVEEIRTYIPSLSKQQLDYVTSDAPVDVALAGPGSGKSTATRAKVLHDIFIGGANPKDYLFTSKTHSANRNFMEAFTADAGTGRRDISELIPEWTRDVRERQVKTLDSVIRRQLHNDKLIQTDKFGNFSPLQLLEHVAKSANHRHLLAEEGLADFQAGSTPLYQGTPQGQKGVYLDDIVESSEKQLRKFIEKALKQQGIEHGHYNLSEVEHYVVDSKQKQQVGDALEQRMARGRALFEQYEQGGRQLPSSQQIDPDLALYVTQQSLGARPGFTIPDEKGPHYTLADEGHMVAAALRIARKVSTVRIASPFKRLVSDEFQDADPNHVRALRELAGGSATASGRPPVRMAFSGDMGQMAIQRSYPIDRQIMEAFHDIGAVQHTFTGNYRSGPYGVALSNSVNLLSVAQGRPKSPNQVSMLPLGKTDRPPKMFVGPDYDNVFEQMIRTWFKHAKTSFTKVGKAIEAGQHPFAHLAGTEYAPGRNPFIFSTKSVQKAFREKLKAMAVAGMGPEHADTFMSKYVLPERTLPGPGHELRMQPLKINEIRGRDASTAYIDVSPAGLWDAAGRADNLRIALSRATMQNRLYASMKVIPGTTPHDMTPSTFQGSAVAPGFDVLLQVMSELAHHQQSVPLQQMPRWIAQSAVAINPLTNAHAGGEGPVHDSALMERYADEVFALNDYYQPPAGAGIHSIDAVGNENVYNQGDEREGENGTAIDRMNIVPAINNLLRRSDKGVDRTQLQLVNTLMRQTLTQGPTPILLTTPKGGKLITDLPEDPKEFFGLLKSMFGHARTKDDKTQMEKIPGAGSNPYFPMEPLPRKEEFSGKTEGVGYRALEKGESDLDPIFGPEGNITGWKPAMKRYYQEYAPLALKQMAHEHGYSSDPNSPGRAADGGEFPSAFIPDDERPIRARMAHLLADLGLQSDPFVRESMPGLMRRFIGEIYEQYGREGMEIVPKAVKELLLGSGPFAVGLTPDFVYATAEATERQSHVPYPDRPNHPPYLRDQAKQLREEYGKHGDIFTPLELSQEGLDRMGQIDPFHALITRHLLQDGSLFLHKDELHRLPQEDRKFLESLWKRGTMSYEKENQQLVMSKEQFDKLSGGEGGEKKRAYQLMRSKLYPVGATNAYGETTMHPEVQKRLHTLDLFPANVMRTLSLQEGEQMGIPLHQMRNAPALARIASYFSLMSKGMGLNETGGVFDPEVGHYSEKHGFQPLGAPMSLPQYEKRLRDRISRMQPDDLKTPWGAQTWQQYDHVRSMRQSFSSPRNQQRYAHVARVLLRATTGQDVQSANYGDRDETDPVKTLFAPAIGHARSIEQIAAVHQAFEGAASHMEEHGGLRRSHVDDLLTALGHDPADQKFGMLRHLEQTYGFAPSDHNSNPFLPLEGLLHQAKLTGKERNSMVAQMTRTPLLPGVQYQFMGGEPEFGDLTLAQEQIAGLRSGMVGQLEHFNEKTPFGTSKYLGATFGARMFSQDESDYWNQFYDRKTKKNEYERLDMQPLFQFNTQTPEGESLRFPVRADQLRLLGLQEGREKRRLPFLSSSDSAPRDFVPIEQRSTPEERARRGSMLPKEWGNPQKGAPGIIYGRGPGKQPPYTLTGGDGEGGSGATFLQPSPHTTALAHWAQSRSGIVGALRDIYEHIGIANARNTYQRRVQRARQQGAASAASATSSSSQGGGEGAAGGGGTAPSFAGRPSSQRDWWEEEMMRQRVPPWQVRWTPPTMPPPPPPSSAGSPSPSPLSLLSGPQARLALPPGRGFTMVPPDEALPDQINLGPTIIPAGGGGMRPLLPEHAASLLWNPDDEPTEKRAAVRPPPSPSVDESLLFALRQTPPPPKPGRKWNGHVPRSFLPPRPEYAQRHSSSPLSSATGSGGGTPPPPPPPPSPPHGDWWEEERDRKGIPPWEVRWAPPSSSSPPPPPPFGSGNNGSSSVPIPNLASLGALLRTSGMVDVGGVRVFPPTDEQRHILDTQQAHMLIEGGPGAGKTLTVGTKIADMVARGEVFPREIVAMSATRSGAQELTKRFGWVQGLLNQIPGIGRDNRYTMPHASTFHGLAYRTLFGKMTPTGEEGAAEAQSSPLMEAMGLGHFKIGNGILSDFSKEKQKWMTPTELEMVKGIHSQSDFFKESVQSYLQGRKGKVAGVEADLLHKVMNGGEKGIRDVLKDLGTMKRGTVADYWGDGAGVKGALKTGEEHIKQGIVSKEALLHLYKKRQDEKGMLDFDDIVNYAGIAMQMAHTGHINPDLLPDFLSRQRLFAVDEGQDLFHNQARLLKGMMEHSQQSGGDPRLLVGFDRGQALFSGMGGIDDPVGVYSAMAGVGKDQLSPIQLRGNMRSDRIDVAMNNAILSMDHMKNVSAKSPLQYPFSPNRGRDPTFKVAKSQRTLYRNAFQSMLKKAGVSFDTMKENVARGAHPFEGIDWNDSKHVLPSEIPMITMTNNQQEAFARHAQGLLAEKLEISDPTRAHDVLKQILQMNPPTDQMSDEDVEQAKYKFWNMKVAGARSHQFLYPHMDVTRVGQWRNDKNLNSYTQGIFTGLSRVSQGGQNTILATNHPPNAWETGNEPDGTTKRREDKKNRFEQYKGQLVPAMFGQILGERDRQLAAFGPPPPQAAQQQGAAAASPPPNISAGQININTGPQPTINVSAQGPTNIGNSGTGMSGMSGTGPAPIGPTPTGPTPTGPTLAHAAGGGSGTTTGSIPIVPPPPPVPPTPGVPSIAGIGAGGGGSDSSGSGGSGKGSGKTPERKQTLANNDESNIGRTLARIGGEMQFVGKLFDQITTQALEQGSAYRRASIPMQGGTGTSGFYDFANGASGISQMSNALPMYSKVQLAQSLRSLSAASGNQMTDVTGGTQSILQLAAVSGVDPSELIGATTNIAGTMGMARNTSLVSSFLGGGLSSLYGNNLSPENVLPTLSAVQQVLPTMQGLNLGGPPQLSPLTALLKAGLVGGMTASNMGDMAQTIGALARVGSAPDLQQQYALSQLFGAKNITADTGLAEYQRTQVGERQQLSELALQQNIGNGMSLPQLQINVAQAEVSMEKANLDMSALQYSHDVASFQFQQQQQTQELGPIGADVSRNSYFNFMRNQMQAGYNPLSAETGTTFKSSPVFGLQNAEFYAGIEHQRTMLTLGRSPLLSDAAFQEQMKYLNEQEAFYHEQLKLQNEQRQFEKTWTQKLLDEQGVLIELQKKRYALDVQMNAYQQKLLHLQEQFLPQQAAALSALIVAQGQSLRGQGPLNGQMVSPDQLVTALAATKDPTQLNTQIRGLNLAPADQGVLLKMVQGVQKYGSLAKLEASQQTTDATNVANYKNMVKQGAFADKANTAAIADAFLLFAGKDGTWSQFVTAFKSADDTWKQIGSETALLNSTMKEIATTLTILGPLLTAVGLMYNLLGFLRNIPGQGGGGGALDYTNPGRYMTGAPKITFFGAGMYPDAPQVNMKTRTVKGKKQYSLDGGKTWQNDNNFVDTALGAVGSFFTKTVPDWWSEFVPQGQQQHQQHGGTPLPSTKNMTPLASGFVSPQVEKSIEGNIGTFFSKTLPEWWTKNVGGPFGAWLGGLPKWWSQNIAGPFNNWLAGLPKWFSQNIGTPFTSWVGTLPKWFSQNIGTPFGTWIGTLPKWWSDNIADPIMKNLITPGQVFFTKTLPDAWNTLFTKTIPNLWSTDVTIPIGTFFSKTLPDLFTKTVTDFLKGGGGNGNKQGGGDSGNIFSSILGMFFGNPPKGGGGPSIVGSTPTGHPGFETPRITTEFGQMSAGHGPHQGVDFAVPQGTPIKEFIGGRVVASSFQPWGGEVDVQIPGGMIERYLHLSALGVTKGQVIPRYGFLGLSGGGTPQSGLGTWSTGPHAHVQIDHGNMLAASNPWPIWAAFGATDISTFFGGGVLPGTAGGGATFGHGGAGGGPSSLYHMAMGGIALSHLRTSVGESGPEAIIPLSRLGAVLKQVQQQQTGGSMFPSGSGSVSSSSSSPRSVVVERLIGTLNLTVGSGGSMSDQEKDELLSDLVDILETAAKRFVDQVHS